MMSATWICRTAPVELLHDAAETTWGAAHASMPTAYSKTTAQAQEPQGSGEEGIEGIPTRALTTAVNAVPITMATARSTCNV